MPGISDTIEKLVVSALLNENVVPTRTSKIDWALNTLSILLCGGGVIFLLIGLARYLELRYQPDTVAFILAAVLLTTSAIAAYAVCFRRHNNENCARQSAVQSSVRQELSNNLHAVLSDLFQELDTPVRENPKAAMLLAAIAGFFAARQKV